MAPNPSVSVPPPQLYTSSRLKVLRECLRKHYYRYTLGIETPTTEPMQFGTTGHKGLEAWYRAWMAGDVENRLPLALAAVEALPNAWDRIKLAMLVRAYDARWGGENWEVLAVEVEFRYLLGDRLLGGKIDAIVRDLNDGRLYVVEHKTTGLDASFGGSYWEKLAIDTQVSIYLDGAAILGFDVSGCIYDVLVRPKHEPKLATPVAARRYTLGKGCKGCGGSGGGKAGIIQGNGYYVVAGPGEAQQQITCDKCKGTGWLCDAAGEPQAPKLHANQRDVDETAEAFELRILEALAEAPEQFLLRGTVVRLEDELPGLRQDVLDDIDLAETGLTPRNSDSCNRYGGMCSFFAACSGRASIDDEQTFPRGPVHPELDVAA